MPWPNITNAEFDRHLKKMNSDVLGAGALARHLLADIGPLDAQNRPQKACSLWWFIAHLEPTATRTTQVRAELQDALRRGDLGADEVQRLSQRWLGDARALVTDDKHLPPAQKRVLLDLISAATKTLKAWREDPTYTGDDFFVVRKAPHKDLTSKDFNQQGGRLYSTADDLWVERNVPSPNLRRSKRAEAASPRRASAEPPASVDALAGLSQRDAVRALMASDVLEMVGQGPAAKGLLPDLGASAAQEVADLHGLKGQRRALFGRALVGVHREYDEAGGKSPAEVAKGILRDLGVSASQTRRFRARLAQGLLAPIVAAHAAPAGGRSFAQARPELVALTEGIEARQSVNDEDVRAIQTFTDSLDLGTIREGHPDYISLLQRVFFHAGMDTDQSAALEPIYWHAVTRNRELIAARSEAKGHTPWETARTQFIAWAKAGHADSKRIRGLIESLDPADVAQQRDFLNSEIGVIALKHFGVNDNQAAEAFRRPLWDLVDQRGGQI